MSARTAWVPALAALTLAGCATAPPAGSASRVSLDELYRNPARWDGRKVVVKGLVSLGFENHALYASWDERCRRGFKARRVAIAVDWDDGVRADDDQRMAVVRGVFHNEYGVPPPDLEPGEVVVGNAPGPGPLKDPQILRRLGPPLPACPG